MNGTARLRRFVFRHGAPLSVALAVVVFWACWVAAHHISVAPIPESVIPAHQMVGIQGLRFVPIRASTVNVTLEDRNDLVMQWQDGGPNAVSWSLEGQEIVLRLLQPVGTVTVRAPSSVTRFHGDSVNVQAQTATPISSISLSLSGGNIEGNVRRITLAMGDLGCSEGVHNSARSYQRSVQVNTIGTNELRVVASSGQLYVGPVPDLRDVDILATRFVGLEVRDITTIQKIRLTQISLEDSHALRKEANAC